MFRKILTGALVLSIAQTAFAHGGSDGVKTRTPETAQSFLQKVFSSGTMRLTSHFPGSSWGMGLSQYYAFQPGYVMAWEKDANAPDNCRSVIKAWGVYSWKEPTDYGWRDDQNPIWVVITPDKWPRWDESDYTSPIKGKGIVIWKNVASISIHGSLIDLSTRLGGEFQFDLGNGELAERAALAMNVLRSACDATADDNF